ncbi:HPF/RaiA family ribosome-associated protein [Bacteriovorax sp. DB6_IX]|uniref:HPF/RaiA family ribosome-associated protein n=1 Tax=Bacteriovorax sp. DB6_IX TaxID=1353530 RepID=UPI00038A2039|nr:HPF/RaiA family ribosome-associated protein [Bacteriovorax sp. DB6_IX]EQC50929.1 putative ribosomal subunit interface protein [Bacteriovorax sp. DB6_IX]
MNYNLSYHHVDHSGAFEQFLEKKLHSMNRLMNGVGRVDFVADRNGQGFRFSARVNGKKSHFYSKADSANVYQAAAKVMARMKAWLHKN